MQRYNRKVEDVDMIIVATSTPDFPFPSISNVIQDRLNIAQTSANNLSVHVQGLIMHCKLLILLSP